MTLTANARQLLENAFRMQRITVEESDAASIASNRSDPHVDFSEPTGPRTVESVVGTRISGHVYKSGSVYGFIKADFQEPDLGEIFFLSREVQGKRRLNVGAHVTFELSHKGDKFRALRIVPLSLPSPTARGPDDVEDVISDDEGTKESPLVVPTTRSWRSPRVPSPGDADSKSPRDAKTLPVHVRRQPRARRIGAGRGMGRFGVSHSSRSPPVSRRGAPFTRRSPSSSSSRSPTLSRHPLLPETTKRTSSGEADGHMHYSKGPDGSPGFGRGSGGFRSRRGR